MPKSKDEYPKTFSTPPSLVYNPKELVIKRFGKPIYHLKKDEKVYISGDQMVGGNKSIILRDGYIDVILKTDRQDL